MPKKKQHQTLKETVQRVQIQIATQRRAQKVRMAKLVRTEHQQVTWSMITVVANATRIFKETIAKQPRHAPQGTMDKPAKTMARRWVHLPKTTANVPVLLGTKEPAANHQRNARRERMGINVRTMDLQLEQQATVLAIAKPGTLETIAKQSCSAPTQPMETFVKMGVQLRVRWRQTIARASAPNNLKVQIVAVAQVACIFPIRIASLAGMETITVVHRVNSKVVQCVRVSFLRRVVFLHFALPVFGICSLPQLPSREKLFLYIEFSDIVGGGGVAVFSSSDESDSLDCLDCTCNCTLGTSTADTQTCGSCPTVPHGTCTLCPGGAGGPVCTAVTCDTGWANNDGNAANGCEEITCAEGTYQLNQVCTECGNVGANGYTCPTGMAKSGKVCDGSSTADTQTCALCPTVPRGTCTLCPRVTTCTAVTCDSGSYKTKGVGGPCKCEIVDVCKECSNNGPKGYTCSSGFYKSGSTCDGKGFFVCFDVVSLTYSKNIMFYYRR